LYAVNVETGALIWKRKLSTYAGAQGNAVSRTSVTLTTDGNLIFCDQIGAIVYSVRAIDGVLNWSKKVNTHQFSQITMSPMVYYNPNYPAQPHMVLVGANSGEEGWIGAGVPNYVCCNFRGSMHGLNLATGEIMWTTWMLPDNFGWTNMTSGAGVWGGML
jgi:polyvinyl alcohol dehydrogenase (cytochrome)